MNWNKLPDYIDIAIVGAGPHALTLMTHLLQKRSKLRSRVMIFDPSGEWLSNWCNQLVAQEIIHLRSPAVHHPDPNPFGLRKFAENRPGELFPPYDLPGTKLFEDFCQEVISRYQLEKMVVPENVTGITPQNGSFKLDLGSGVTILARRVVLAINGGIPNLPNWVKKLQPPTLVHSSQVDLRELNLTGERVLIVGGGLTSGHLAVGAIARGATVEIMARRPLQEKLFDADSGWLGPKYLKGFQAETCWEKRFTMIKEARNGGSMTPAMMLKLRRLSREGKLKLEENCQVNLLHCQGSQWEVQCENGQICHYNRIWLATGSRFEAENHPLLGDIWEKYQTPMVQGLPVLDEYLRVKGTELFIMGGLAALRLGPTARNLSGAIKASRLITEALIKPSLAVI